MTTQEMKKKLIEAYNVKQLSKINKYTKKLSGMVVSQVQQEYDLVVLGKEYKPKKKKIYKEESKQKAKKEDVKGMW